ncbi:hypothetical protein [Petropleomorpha daqingensis]|uniref:Uncharacterized protein n=1 Tax=Petropleomorpha daqingensis TaxID=2026353 RepID=A0A853CLV4_9ACTN|nr:hypothetical protein [Petropleomorpha daqingensis]NYJ08885.1 hypothetical protein [Petropleomorpha daqingensis]
MQQHGTRPAASWVLGRSARWHTPEGAAILAEDGVAEDRRRDLAAVRATEIGAFSGVLVALLRLLVIAWRTFRRERD